MCPGIHSVAVRPAASSKFSLCGRSTPLRMTSGAAWPAASYQTTGNNHCHLGPSPPVILSLPIVILSRAKDLAVLTAGYAPCHLGEAKDLFLRLLTRKPDTKTRLFVPALDFFSIRAQNRPFLCPLWTESSLSFSEGAASTRQSII